MSDVGGDSSREDDPGPHDAAGPAPPPGEITRLLQNWAEGDQDAVNELFPVVYRELRGLADRYLRRERDGHTLTPTALVHEAYLRLTRADPRAMTLANRTHFFAFAAQAMRRILVEHARYHAAARRPSPREAVRFEEGGGFDRLPEGPFLEVIAVHEALERLRVDHPRHARIVELRYFGGLPEEDVAAVLGVSRSTIAREWRLARILLRRLLRVDAQSGAGR